MESFKQIVDTLLHFVIQIGDFLVSVIIAIELWLRNELARAGLPPDVQTILMLAVAALLIIGSLRVFGGLIRVAVVLLLVLVAIHIIMPVLPA